MSSMGLAQEAVPVPGGLLRLCSPNPLSSALPFGLRSSSSMAGPGSMVGGFSGSKQVDEEVSALVGSVKGDVEKHLDSTFETFEPHSVKTQVVAGINYRVKVNVGDDKFVHVTVHKPLPHKNEAPKVLSAEAGKTLEDEL